MMTTRTPAYETGAVDLRQVRIALDGIKTKQLGGRVIVMKSTAPPGTRMRLFFDGTNCPRPSADAVLRLTVR